MANLGSDLAERGGSPAADSSCRPPPVAGRTQRAVTVHGAPCAVTVAVANRRGFRPRLGAVKNFKFCRRRMLAVLPMAIKLVCWHALPLAVSERPAA